MRCLIRHFLVPGIFLLLQGAVSGQDPGKLDLEWLDTYIENSLNAWHVPGLAIAILDDEEKIDCYNYANN